ncbi:hypothetical protein ADL21_11345 [Streptomyces albus subsp. albus]|nr:hypothetical protein ADL21_11345 [Streptomyces albus subsp. albus]
MPDPPCPAVPGDAPQTLAELLRQLHDALFAAAARGHPELYEQAHDFLDADADTQYPADGDPHFPLPTSTQETSPA